MGDQHPDILQTTSSRSLRIPTLGRVPNVEDDVFISVEGTVEQLKVLLEKFRVVFVRAGVASGKTTLAQYMVEELGNEFVEVEYADTTKGWYGQFVRASGRTELGDDLVVSTREALRDIGKQGKTIVIDEAHILFSYPDVIRLVVKETEKRNGPKILLFSAAATGHKDGVDSTTLPEVKARYMWHPPIPPGNALVDPLKDAGVRLSADSVDFFMKLCSGRRGIFMHAMDWVKEQQEGSADEEWDYRETISRVRQSLDERRKSGLNGWTMGLFKYLKESRAVRVSGRYSDLNNIPREFVEVLYGGPKTKMELNGRERDLTVAGFLIPEQQKMGEEFEPYDWDFPNVRYAISCSIMAEFYNDAFAFALDYGFELIPQKRCPSSAADLLACVVPFLSFATVVDNPIPDSEGKLHNSLSYEGMPHEDNYNNAISSVLSNTLKYTVANPLGASGKTAVVVTLEDNKTCAIESIMASRGRDAHLEHAARFFNSKKTNYANAHYKALVIIGSSRATVEDRISCIGEDYVQGGLEIIGLVHAPAFDSYEMLLRDREESRKKHFFFVCDHVAKSLEYFENVGLLAAQRLVRKREHEDETTPEHIGSRAHAAKRTKKESIKLLVAAKNNSVTSAVISL